MIPNETICYTDRKLSGNKKERNKNYSTIRDLIKVSKRAMPWIFIYAEYGSFC